jgi:tRNA pseudouridine55 synthase
LIYSKGIAFRNAFFFIPLVMEQNFKDKTNYDFAAGEVILIDKPYQWTSFDVVKKVRNAVKIKKVGHAGTLDPLATGLLIVCTGKMTKQINEYQALYKEYTGEIRLGQTTPSFDLETEVDSEKDIAHLTEEMIREAAESFVGEQMQVPPVFSAVKVDGKRAYESARKGQEVKLAPKPIQIFAFDITAINLPIISFQIACTKGTYIRSIARDIGEKLSTGGHLTALRRTAIGTFKVEDALDVNEAVNRIYDWRREAEQL